MFDWYRDYKQWKAESIAVGGVDEFGLDIEDDRPLIQKLTKPYEPEETLGDLIAALRVERPELFR